MIDFTNLPTRKKAYGGSLYHFWPLQPNENNRPLGVFFSQK